jgi:hypothetical protein
MRFALRLTIAISLFVTLTVGSVAGAAIPTAATVSLGVAPSLLELNAKPGATGTQTLTVSNQGDTAVDVTTAVSPLRTAADAESAVSWLSVDPATFHVEPGQNQKVTVTITVPEGLASGGYYAAVTITTGATKSNGGGAGIAGQLGVPFLIEIDGKGKISRKASVERFAPVLEADGRIGFRALVKSTGNTYVVAKGAIQVDQADGKKLGSLEFPETTAILPNTEQLLTSQGSLPLQIGASYTSQAQIDFGAKKPVTARAAFAVNPPVLAATNLAVCENLDKGPTLSFGVHNDGDLGALPTVTLGITQENGSTVGSAPLPRAPLVWPHDTSTFSADFPQRLVSGAYTFTVTVQLPNGQPVTQQLPFQIGGTGPTVAPLCGQEATPQATPGA